VIDIEDAKSKKKDTTEAVGSSMLIMELLIFESANFLKVSLLLD